MAVTSKSTGQVIEPHLGIVCTFCGVWQPLASEMQSIATHSLQQLQPLPLEAAEPGPYKADVNSGIDGVQNKGHDLVIYPGSCEADVFVLTPPPPPPCFPELEAAIKCEDLETFRSKLYGETVCAFTTYGRAQQNCMSPVVEYNSLAFCISEDDLEESMDMVWDARPMDAGLPRAIFHDLACQGTVVCQDDRPVTMEGFLNLLD